MARTGKIARLPAVLREEVCRRLYDGASGPDILDWLNAEPAAVAVFAREFGGAAANPQNLSEWRMGGYQDWLVSESRRERLAETARMCAKLAGEGEDILGGVTAIAAGRMLEVVESVDWAGQARLMAEKPEAAAGFVGSLARLQDSALGRRRLALEEARHGLGVQRFQRETAEMFLKFYEDKRAKEIAANGEMPKEGKMQALIALMFGEEPGEDEP